MQNIMNFKLMNLRIITISLATLFILWSCGSGGGGSDSPEPTPTPSITATPTSLPLGRTWTVDEILSEPRMGGLGGAAECGGEFGFKRCICAPSVRSAIRYRPSVVECNGNAAAILHDQYVDIFSIAVRDSQNTDRFPEAGSGFGGCNFSLANSENPPNRCSAFKVQDKFVVAGGTAMVHCFGASGYSEIFNDAVRMTLKLSDVPNSSEDPLERYCLYSGDLPLN